MNEEILIISKKSSNETSLCEKLSNYFKLKYPWREPINGVSILKLFLTVPLFLPLSLFPHTQCVCVCMYASTHIQ